MSPLNVDSVELALPRLPTAPGDARRQVTAMCHDLHEDVTTIATLLTSELVTNALRHSSGAIALTVDRSPGQLRVAVQDESAEHPVIHAAPLDSTGGRGLLLVETLANGWGVQPRPGDGKSVWFALRVQG